MKLNLTKLRKQGRPLWLRDLNVDDYSDFLGDGGDIHTGRLPPMWERHSGMEFSEDESRQLAAGGLIPSAGSEAAV